MKLWALMGVALVIVAPRVAAPQAFGPAHQTIATIGTGTGTTNQIPAFNRRLLAIFNDSANVVYCTVDGSEAVANQGIRLAAAGTTGDRILFDRQVPQGPLRCYSATNLSRILILEGR